MAHGLQDWETNYGYTLAKNVEYTNDSIFKTSKYVSKYCSKGVFENPKVAQMPIEKPFRLVSKSLGIIYVDKFKNHHLTPRKDYPEILRQRRVVLPNNTSYSMPRYYKTKIYGEKNLLSYRLLCEVEKSSDNLYVSKLAQIQADHPTWSPLETFLFFDLQTSEDAKYKAQRNLRNIAQFYERSKL